MDNSTKKKYLEFLESSDMYKFALSQVKDESEKRKIKAFAEDILVNLVEGLTVAKKLSEEHPEKMAEVAKERIPKE